MIRKHREIELTAILLFAFTGGELRAQTTAPTPIAPIEVIATREPRDPHAIPVSVEVISGADLRARGVTSLRDALALSAGVSIGAGGDGGPASAIPEFWGLRELDAFLLVVDGVPRGGAFNPAVSSISLRDVDRIEILRGPAPVTFGATSFVGVIHIVHTAAATAARYVDGHAGTFGSGGAAVELPLPLMREWSSRLSAGFDREGFKDTRTSFSRGHALVRTEKAVGASRTWLSADVNLLRQDPASPHPREGTALSPAVPLDANYNPAGAFLNENRFSLAAGFNRALRSDVSWANTISYAFSSQNIFRGFLTDVSNTANNASGFEENIDVHDLYADSHLLWPVNSTIHFLLGADALLGRGEAEGATFSYTAPLNASTAPAVTRPANFDKDAEDERRFLGAYGSADWSPITQLSVNAGLRLNATSEKRGQGTEVNNTRLSGGVGAILGILERDADHLRVFANYRNTFKPAAVDFGLGDDEENVLKPETSRSYEAGVKARGLDGRVDFEASVFQMDFDNLVTSTVIGGVPELRNAGKTRFKGVELESEIRFPYALTARGTVSFHDGKFVDYVQTFGGKPTQLGGKRFEMSARRLASAGLTWAPASGLLATATASYTGDRYLNKRNTALAPAFTTLDGGIGYRMNRYEFRVDARNLTNRRDAVAESEFGDSQFYRMPARSIKASVTTGF